MKASIFLLLAAGLAGIGFGWWGLETDTGRAAFDEMAGMIPFFAGVAGWGALVLALLLSVIRWWRARRRDGASSIK